MKLPFINNPPITHGNIQAGQYKTDMRFITSVLKSMEIVYIKYNSLYNDLDSTYWFLRLIQHINIPIDSKEPISKQTYILETLRYFTDISLKFKLTSTSNSNGNPNFLLVKEPTEQTLTILHTDIYSIEPYIPIDLESGQYIISLYNLAGDMYDYQIEFGPMYAKHFFVRTLLPSLIIPTWNVTYRSLILLQDETEFKRQMRKLTKQHHAIRFSNISSRTIVLISYYRKHLRNIPHEHAFQIANQDNYLNIQIYNYMHLKFITNFYERSMAFMEAHPNEERGRFYLPLMAFKLSHSKQYKEFIKLV